MNLVNIKNLSSKIADNLGIDDESYPTEMSSDEYIMAAHWQNDLAAALKQVTVDSAVVRYAQKQLEFLRIFTERRRLYRKYASTSLVKFALNRNQRTYFTVESIQPILAAAEKVGWNADRLQEYSKDLVIQSDPARSSPLKLHTPPLHVAKAILKYHGGVS